MLGRKPGSHGQGNGKGSWVWFAVPALAFGAGFFFFSQTPDKSSSTGRSAALAKKDSSWLSALTEQWNGLFNSGPATKRRIASHTEKPAAGEAAETKKLEAKAEKAEAKSEKADAKATEATHATAETPSKTKPEATSAHAKAPAHDERPAAAEKAEAHEKTETKPAHVAEAFAVPKTPLVLAPHPASDDSDDRHAKTGYQLVRSGSGATEKLATVEEIQASAMQAGACKRYEVRGESPAALQVDAQDWSLVMNTFHEAKRELGTWLKLNEKKLGSENTRYLDRLASRMRLQRPPFDDEPDLAWRGVAVYEQDPKEGGTIRVGGGFIRLVRADRVRAKFEFTRLLAQAWAPCELKREKPDFEPWNGLLACLGEGGTEGKGEQCNGPSVSEAGWAAPTAIAFMTSPPGCEVPAFVEAKSLACLKLFQGTEAFQAYLDQRFNPTADASVRTTQAAPKREEPKSQNRRHRRNAR